MSGWKKFIMNFLGVITTAATLAVIYFVLYMTGAVKSLSNEVIIEYIVMLVLSLITKSFWYVSIESSFRTSKEYTDLETTVLETMNTLVEDTYDFDEFISNENIVNYNKYITSKCRGLTVDNYKYKFYDNIERLFRCIFHHKKDKRYYAIRYIHKIESKASKLHQLSSANILTFNSSGSGLTDDRNIANKKKFMYIIGGSLMSAIFTFVTAMIGFDPRTDVDERAAVIKMIMYSAQIIMSVLQTIMQAHMNVKSGDTEYFRKIENILEKYRIYKENPQVVTYITYELKEVNNAANKYSADKGPPKRHNVIS